jgi:hypothetical protein
MTTVKRQRLARGGLRLARITPGKIVAAGGGSTAANTESLPPQRAHPSM